MSDAGDGHARPREARGGGLRVVRAPPFLTVQDLGRPGHRHLGVPAGGAMDRWALQAANLLAGNAPGAAALEWAVGGGAVRFARDAAFALTGADAGAALAGAPVATWRTLHARAGDTLEIAHPRGGRFVYLAVAGGVWVPPVLGSASTYLPAAFGGVEGRRLRPGDLLPLGAPQHTVPRGFACPPELRRDAAGPPPGEDAAPLGVTPGPQAELLDDDAWTRLLGPGYALSATADRTGYRLAGPVVRPRDPAAARPSEPGCPGAVQLPPNGQPIVLMADAPTVGGYPKPAVLCAADLGRLAQRAPDDPVRLEPVTVEEAQRRYRRRRVALWTLERMLAG